MLSAKVVFLILFGLCCQYNPARIANPNVQPVAALAVIRCSALAFSQAVALLLLTHNACQSSFLAARTLRYWITALGLKGDYRVLATLYFK